MSLMTQTSIISDPVLNTFSLLPWITAYASANTILKTYTAIIRIVYVLFATVKQVKLGLSCAKIRSASQWLAIIITIIVIFIKKFSYLRDLSRSRNSGCSNRSSGSNI